MMHPPLHAVKPIQQHATTALVPSLQQGSKTLLARAWGVKKLSRFLCVMVLSGAASALHAQSGVVVLQIHVTLPTCAIAPGVAPTTGDAPALIGPRCVVPLVAQNSISPQTTQVSQPLQYDGTSSKSVLQLTYL